MIVGKLLLDQQVALGSHARHPARLVNDWQRVNVVILDQADELTKGADSGPDDLRCDRRAAGLDDRGTARSELADQFAVV